MTISTAVTRHVALHVGLRLEYDGSVWEIAEIDLPTVILNSRGGLGLRQVSISHLLANPDTRLLVPEAAEQHDAVGVFVSNLSGTELDELRARVGHVQEVRTGYTRGHQGLALPGEPRPAFEPGLPKLARYAAKAKELGVAVSTVRRWVADFEREGPEALVDQRRLRTSDPLGGVDVRWLDMARTVLAEHTDASRPTQNLVLLRIRARLDEEHGHGCVAEPSTTRARHLLRELTRGTHAFGGTKTKRSVASRPAQPYGRLRATRPGEYLLLDTTPLDVYAMDPLTLCWVKAELTVAMDLYDRCIAGLRVTPVSTKAVDAAAVLFEAVRPLPDAVRENLIVPHLYHGLPRGVVIDAEKLVDADGSPLLPSVAAETVVVDNGKIYLSEHFLSACQRNGISVQPARPFQGSDKAALERFFRTLREQLLAALPAYKGPDVHSRGLDVENQAFYFLDELESIIREWVASCYHRQPHRGLRVPEVPGLDLSPLEMYGHGINRAGYLQIPARPDLVFDFLRVEWRTIQHYGVEIAGLRYDGRVLKRYRDRTSPHSGRHAGKWPIHIDDGDVSRVYFQDPANREWHALNWEHASTHTCQFSSEAVAYARRLAAAEHRFPDTKRALIALLTEWDAGLTRNPTERRMAVRLSERRLRLVTDEAIEPQRPLPAPASAYLDPPVPSLEPAFSGDSDDDEDEELSAAFPGDEDFYGDAMGIA